MRCPICDSTDKWKNVDEFRIKPEGMAMCGGCGFVSYPEKYKTKQEIIDYYSEEYRPAPGFGNVCSGERKLHYHGEFLKDLLKQFKDEGREQIVVTDIGSAFGMFLNWFRGFFPKGEYTGVELTKSFVRNAWHLFQLKTLNDFDDTKKYDFISSYKSLEHILDPDIELKRYINSLKDNGYLYLSVPTWFGTLKSFGMSGFDLEYYYSPNHINVWTRKMFEGLIGKCGGKVIKENHTMYENTYLVVKGEITEPVFESPEYILECLKKVYEANEAYSTGRYEDAINIWPNFPIAHYGRYEMNRKQWDVLGFDIIFKEVCERALRDCPDDSDANYLCADICMRYGRYEDAIKYLNQCQKLRPNMPNVFSMLANCFRMLGDHSIDESTKIRFYEESRKCAILLRNIGSQNISEALTWIMHDNANIPTPMEK